MKNDTSSIQQPGNRRRSMGVISLLREAFVSKRYKELDLFNQIKETLVVDDQQLYIGDLLKRAATLFSNKTAIIFKDKIISYKELHFRSILLSQKLISLGVKPKDKVLMCFENSIDFAIAYFGILQTGAVCVPLNIFLHEKELGYIINDAEVSFVIASNALALKFNKALITVLTSDVIDYDTPVSHSEFQSIKLEQNEMCLLLYTSGTTGVPKGVMLSSKNIITNVVQCTARLGSVMSLTMRADSKTGFFEADERFFAALPLFHVFAQNSCMWFPFLIGSSIIMVPKIERKDILEGLSKKPTIFFGVPALYGLLCLLKTAPLDSIKFFVSGADALPDKIRSAFSMIYGRKICGGYGLTEASPVTAVNIDNNECKNNVVGSPLMGIECQIRDENNKILEFGQRGTLWIHGDNVMLGYYKSEEETSRVLQDGWLNTGDLACFDEHGHLAIVGRSKDLIIHKGFNIYPQEVENVLLTYPAVFKAAVIGQADVSVGQVPIAYVAIREDSGDLELKLRAFCMERLATYKVPRKFICLDDLPMNATGKVDKKILEGNYK